MSLNLEELKLYLPKFLSAESDSQLFEGLKDFPNNIESRFYTTALENSTLIFQGDGFNNLSITNLPDNSIKNSKGLIYSNTCDLDPNNKRNFPAHLVYAPIVDLEKYKSLLIKSSNKKTADINAHINAIKNQRISQIFYLPKNYKIKKEAIVFLDRVNNYPLDIFLKYISIESDRLFTLSNLGAYLFVFKLSVHFTRIQDNVDRNAGVLS